MWCVYIYILQWNITQPLKGKKLGCFSETWMDLEMVIQSDISQKENINKYIWNQENGVDDHICKTETETWI